MGERICIVDEFLTKESGTCIEGKGFNTTKNYESATYKRGKPRAQGRIYKRLKRTSHLTVKVSDGAKA